MSVLKNKNVLVTGGTGLVGSHLTEKLIDLGANVVCTYRSLNPRSYFAQNNMQNKVIMAACDFKDFDRVFDIVTKYEIDYIFHLGAQPIVDTAYHNPLETLADNITGSINILESARRYPKVKGVMIASSDKAYGKGSVDAVEDFPVAGDHPYDVSKSCVDLIARTYYKTYGVPVAVSRFGNIYGPGDLNANRIVPGIMNAIINDEVLELRSDGSFVRDYVYVKEVVEGYILLAENLEKTKGEAFNFSTGYNFSVLELVEKIPTAVGKKCKYKIVNNQKNEIPAQSLNFEKAAKILGWKEKYTFEEGIKETYEWYVNNIKK